MSFILFIIIIGLLFLLFQLKKENNKLHGLLADKNDADSNTLEADEEPCLAKEERSLAELSPEEESAWAEEAEKVRVLCKAAECHLQNISDESEYNKLNEVMEKSIAIAKSIPDEFYSYSALGFVVKLAHDAGMKERKDALLKEIKNPMLADMVLSSMK